MRLYDIPQKLNLAANNEYLKSSYAWHVSTELSFLTHAMRHIFTNTNNTTNCCYFCHPSTIYPKKYAHGFVVLCFVVVMQSFIMNSHEVFIHIHQGCFAGAGAIVRLPQRQWSKPDGYGKISLCITTTKHSKAKTACIFLGIYCKMHCLTPSEGTLRHIGKQTIWINYEPWVSPYQTKARQKFGQILWDIILLTYLVVI